MKPVIVIPQKCMSKADIAELRKAGFCVVEAQDPSLVRFIEPPPMGYSVQEQAAVKLCRCIAKNNVNSQATPWSYSVLMSKLAELMIEGTPLAPVQGVDAVKR
jgi:hypothetical protein